MHRLPACQWGLCTQGGRRIALIENSKMGQREAKYQPVTTKLFSTHAGSYSRRAELQNIPLASQSQLSGPLTFEFLSCCPAADLHTPQGYFKRMSSHKILRRSVVIHSALKFLESAKDFWSFAAETFLRQSAE